MSLHQQAKIDIQTITSNSLEFGVPVVFLNPDSETVTLNCIPSEHHTSFDSDGLKINSKQASVGVSELLLDASDYSYKLDTGEISFEGHLITLEGTQYIAREWFPDRTIGLIIVILSEYEQD